MIFSVRRKKANITDQVKVQFSLPHQIKETNIIKTSNNKMSHKVREEMTYKSINMFKEIQIMRNKTLEEFRFHKIKHSNYHKALKCMQITDQIFKKFPVLDAKRQLFKDLNKIMFVLSRAEDVPFVV